MEMTHTNHSYDHTEYYEKENVNGRSHNYNCYFKADHTAI